MLRQQEPLLLKALQTLFETDIHGLVAGRDTLLEYPHRVARVYPADGAVAVSVVVLAHKAFFGAVKDVVVVVVVGEQVIEEDVLEFVVDEDDVVFEDHAVDLVALFQGFEIQVLDDVFAGSREVEIGPVDEGGGHDGAKVGALLEGADVACTVAGDNDRDAFFDSARDVESAAGDKVDGLDVEREDHGDLDKHGEGQEDVAFPCHGETCVSMVLK